MWDLPIYQDGQEDVVLAKHFNSVTGELKSILSANNIIPINADSSQLMQSIDKTSKSWYYNTDASLGSANEIVLVKALSNNAVDSLFDGCAIIFKASHNNTDAVNIKVNQNNPHPALLNNKPLVAGDININDTFLIKYNNTTKKFDLQLIGYNIGSRGVIPRADYDALEQKVIQGLVPAGAIFNFSVEREINGYFICDGREFVGSDYPLLARHLDPDRNPSRRPVKIPDLQGLFIRGFDKKDHEDDTVKDLDRIFGSIQLDRVKDHYHWFGRNTIKYLSRDNADSFLRVDRTDQLDQVLPIKVVPDSAVNRYSGTDSNNSPYAPSPEGFDESRPVNIAYNYYIGHGN